MTNARIAIAALALASALLTSGCKEDKSAAAPPAQEPTADATSVFCNMALVGHPGPKGQIFLKDHKAPLWFSSARDTIAFTLLPEEPKEITAIYVNDMGKADWDSPQPGTWIDAKKAWYVIGSSRTGGMGAAEAVPFADKAAGSRFAQHYGGHLIAFAEIPTDYILGGDASDHPALTSQPPLEPSAANHNQHGSAP